MKRMPTDEEITGCRADLESLARRMLGETAPQYAEDAVSDALLKAITTFDDEKGATFGTWVHTILENRCKDILEGADISQRASPPPSLDDDGGEGDPMDRYAADDGSDIEEKLREYQAEGVDLIMDFLEGNKPGQSFHDWYPEDDPKAWICLLTWGDHWHIFGIRWNGNHQPKFISTLRKYLRNATRKTGTDDTAVSRLKKILKEHKYR